MRFFKQRDTIRRDAIERDAVERGPKRTSTPMNADERR
jgi:hypothetical protein